MQKTQLKRIAEGREAEIFAWENGAVLKLYRYAEALPQLEAEEAAMTAAKAANAPAPTALGRTEIDGRPGLIMERIDGIDMLTELGAKPWKIFSVGPAMAHAHVAMHATIAPPTLPVLKQALPERLRRSPLVPPDIRDFALESLADLPDGDRLCHGDFHPANIIMAAQGPVVIDWPNSVRGDPHADIARTLLMMRMGELPEGSPRLIRLLEGIGRKIILARYLATYRKLSGLDDALLARWEVPIAAHRLGDNIPEERERLMALVRARMPGGA
jgi:Ser/Thr protein kinase RdoA (MazF antagonist)